MSADNGIYIAEFNDGFRVAHCQAIENIDDDREKYAKLFFGKSKVHKEYVSAYSEAIEIENDIMNGMLPIIEHGICKIPNLGDFPK